MKGSNKDMNQKLNGKNEKRQTQVRANKIDKKDKNITQPKRPLTSSINTNSKNNDRYNRNMHDKNTNIQRSSKL